MRKACLGIIAVLVIAATTAAADRPTTRGPLAEAPTAARLAGGGLQLSGAENRQGFLLTVSTPSGVVIDGEFTGREAPLFDILDEYGLPLEDGQYTYEVRPIVPSFYIRDQEAEGGRAATPFASSVLDGGFLVANGELLAPSFIEEPTPRDVTHADDVIITGSLCIGYDCATDGTESFGFDTIKMKENNLRILFDDTSATAGFAANDWRITVNDSSSGGANYFSIDDATNSRVPFKILAGAPTSSIYLDASGRLGLGTATPVLDVHVVSGDSPAMRFDQDTSSGLTAQTWDVVGNESNFFVRDVTGGSTLPFRIQPGTPTDTVTMKSTGYVGIGTWAPTAPLEIARTSENSELLVNRTDGANAVLSCSDASVDLGSENDYPINFIVNGYTAMTLGTNGYLGVGVNAPTRPIDVAGGAYCDGNTWIDASSRSLKRDIAALDEREARDALAGLAPVKFRYRNDGADQHVGFIAEDVPALVATADRKGMSPMDVVAVLTRVVQAQEQAIASQKATIGELKARLDRLEK
jgi:hypothetical protein